MGSLAVKVGALVFSSGIVVLCLLLLVADAMRGVSCRKSRLSNSVFMGAIACLVIFALIALLLGIDLEIINCLTR